MQHALNLAWGQIHTDMEVFTQGKEIFVIGFEIYRANMFQILTIILIS